MLYTAVFAKGFTLDFHAPLQTWEEAVQAKLIVGSAKAWLNDALVVHHEPKQKPDSTLLEADVE